MSRSFILISIVISLCSANLCFSQTGKVSGTLTFDDGSPLAFATVYIPSVKKHALSSESGWYEIANVPYGDHQLEISSIEIPKGASYSIQVNSSSVSGTFRIKRAEASVLDEIVVEGETEKKRIETSGYAVNVIETKAAALQSVQTNDLLDRTVGVRVRRNGGMGSAVDYNLNGMSGNSVRIFIDGLPASTYGPSFSLNSIPPALIERIEIYKGVLPAHLSGDALGGAINVVLKKEAANNLTASVSYGSFNTFQGNFSGMYRNDKTGLSVRASGFYNYSDNDYEIWGRFVRNTSAKGKYEYVRVKRFNDAYKSLGGQVSVGFTRVKWADEFFINYNGSDDYNEIQHGTYMSIPYKGRFTESQSHAIGLSYRKADLFLPGLEATFNGMLSDRSEVTNDTVKWNYNWFGELSIGLKGKPSLRPNGAQQGPPTINHINRNVATFRAGINYDINDRHKIIFNHVLHSIDRDQQDKMKSRVEREFVETSNQLKNISSLAYEVKLFESRLQTSLFGKYYEQKIEHIKPVLIKENGESVRTDIITDAKTTNVGGGLTLSYKILPNLMLLTSLERAIRMPSENEMFGSQAENIEENLGLKPEISDNLNLGFRAGSFKISDHEFSISATGFIRDTKDKIVQEINEQMNDAIQTAGYENLSKTKSIGFDAELGYSFKNALNVLVNVSRFNSVYNVKYDENGQILPNYNKQLPNEPFFTINSSIQYTVDDVLMDDSRVNIYYAFGFVESFYTTWQEYDTSLTPQQYVHDIGINYAFPQQRFVISADVTNIFDKQVYDNYAVQKPGRAFYLKLNYTINNF